MGIAKPQNQGGTRKPTTFLSFGMFYEEHKRGEKASTSSEPLGACFKKSVKNGEEWGTEYLVNFDTNYSFPIYGELTKIAVLEKEMKGKTVKYLSITLSDPSERVNIQFPLSTSQGGLSTITYDVVKSLMSIKKFGVLILTPWLQTKHDVKVGEKYVPYKELESAGIVGKDGNLALLKEKYPTGVLSTSKNARIAFNNISHYNDAVLLEIAEGNLGMYKNESTKVKVDHKILELLPKTSIKVVDGEEVTIDNSKKRFVAIINAIEDLAKRLEAQKAEEKSVKSTKIVKDKQVEEEGHDDEEIDVPIHSEDSSNSLGEDDLPF